MADWDINNPADDGIVSQYPANERDQREAVRTIFNEDHIQAEGADQGKHRAVRLKSQGSDPGGVGAQGAIYTKTVGGLTELFFINGAGTVVQLTENGKMKAPLVDDLVTTETLADGVLDNSPSGRLKMDAGYFNVSSQALDKFANGFWANSVQTLAKFGDGVWSASSAARAKFGDGFLTTSMISSSAVTTSKIANSAVTSEKLATNAVRDATASLGVGEVGTYAMLKRVDSFVGMTAGTTANGSDLRYSDADGVTEGTPSGVWRLMGRVSNINERTKVSMWLRIS